MELDHDFAGAELPSKLLERALVSVTRCASGELIAKRLGYLTSELCGALEVEAIVGLEDPECRAQFVVRPVVHADEHAAALPLATSEVIDLVCYESPTTEVEESDAEISAVRRNQRAGQRRKELAVNVVEDTSHASLTDGR
jgi:hypothetical protein